LFDTTVLAHRIPPPNLPKLFTSMYTNSNKKNVSTSRGVGKSREDEDIDTPATMLSAVVAEQCSSGFPAPFQSIEIQIPTLSPAKRSTVTWGSDLIPFPSNEYRRSRTVFEINDAIGSTIMTRIFESNRMRSIYADYKGAIATCKTTSFVKFTIKLLRKSEDTDIIIVDVRRRAGCCMAFRDEYQAILRAATSGEITLRQDAHTNMGSLADMPFMLGKGIPLDEEIIDSSLATSSLNLSSKFYDTRELTLQDLVLTTDPACKETSPKACKLIVEKYPKIFTYIVEDILKLVEYSDLIDYDSEEYLRSLTLNLLGNVLSSDPKNSTLISLIQSHQLAVSIEKALVWYVSKAFACPWNACLAAKCLRILVPISSQNHKNASNISETLQDAEKVGIASYMLLAEEARAAIAEINRC